MGGIALASSVHVVFVLAFLFGAAQIVLAQTALVSVHAATPDVMRGRVMGLWVLTFQGSSLFGALLSGWLADAVGVRAAMLVGAVALGPAGSVGVVAIRRASWRLGPAAATG